jgi:hypothetical protein
MREVHDYGRLETVPSLAMNQMQDAAAPVVPFVGYKRGGDLQTKVAGAKIVYVSPLALCLGANGVDTGENTAETSIDVTGLTTASSIHYLYARITSGAISYAVGGAGSVPDEQLVYRFGDETLRYLGWFRTDGSNNVLPFMKIGHRYKYRRSQVANTVFRIGGASFGAQAWGFIETTDGTNPFCPPHIRMISVLMHGQTTTGNVSAALATFGDGGVGYEAGRLFCAKNGGDNIQNQMLVELECNSAQRIDLYNDIGTLDLYFDGCLERSV